MAHDIESRLAVCSWSLQPETPEALVAHLGEIGIPRVQLALDPLRENPGAWGHTAELFAAEGIGIRSEEHTSELQSRTNLACRLLLEKKKLHIFVFLGSIPPPSFIPIPLLPPPRPPA